MGNSDFRWFSQRDRGLMKRTKHQQQKKCQWVVSGFCHVTTHESTQEALRSNSRFSHDLEQHLTTGFWPWMKQSSANRWMRVVINRVLLDFSPLTGSQDWLRQSELCKGRYQIKESFYSGQESTDTYFHYKVKILHKKNKKVEVSYWHLLKTLYLCSNIIPLHGLSFSSTSLQHTHRCYTDLYL